jgi:hypothetical protein
MRRLIQGLRSKEDNNLEDYRVALSDLSGMRRWRSFLNPEHYWDVAVLELDQEDLSRFEIKPWLADELLPAETDLAPGTKVVVLTYPQGYGKTAVPCDAHAMIDLQEYQIFASDRGALITQPLYPGASGSPVYRFLEISPSILKQDEVQEADNPIQLVGIFTGAFPTDDPQGGHFHYAETVAAIMHTGRDCLDEEGLNFRRY